MVYRPRGILDQDEIDRIVAFLDAEENRADWAFDRFTDTSNLDAVDLTFQLVFRVSLHRRLAYAKRPPVKSALFVTSPATERIAKLHAMLTDHSPLQVRMFEELPAAAKWLGVSVKTLEY